MKTENRARLEFSYTISDERLLAYSRVPLLDRLRWLDEVRQFTLIARAAAPKPKQAGADLIEP